MRLAHERQARSSRLLALAMALTTVMSLRPATGAPGDIFTNPAPAIGADPPKAADIKHGDASVATQTGALTYSYPIAVPPGRNGMAPQLALSYSSQSPTYGGIAAGWTLNIPMISEDLSHGRLRDRSPQVEHDQVQQGIDPKLDDRFVSSMAGGRPLFIVEEPSGVASDVYRAYRAANDSTYTRYERMMPGAPYRWRARTTDGRVYTFGEDRRAVGCPTSDQWAPLTGMVDQFGNEVRYEYTQMTWGECRITRITWGQNISLDAPLPAFAQVTFSYKVGSTCNGVYTNSQIDYRSGTKIMTGAGTLTTITATAFEPGNAAAVVHTRTINLDYDDDKGGSEMCFPAEHAPIRLLVGIRESAFGIDSPLVTLPPVRFDYNTAHVALDPAAGAPTGAPWSSFLEAQNLGWGYRRDDDRWPTVETMFVDIDGDGLQDFVRNTSADSGSISSCTAEWWKNLGADASTNIQFVPKGTIALPRLKWHGSGDQLTSGAAQAERDYPSKEGCALNGQVTAYKNSNDNNSGVCHDPSSPMCGAATDPTDPLPYCFPGGTYCPPDFGGVPNGVFRTYLAYRWLDVDADGLTDLVAAVHGDIDTYDIERGNLPGYVGGEPSMSGIPGVGQWPACDANANAGGGTQHCKRFDDCFERRGARTCTASGCTIDWGTVASCVTSAATVGCASVIAKPAGGPQGAPGSGIQRAPYMRCEGLYPWFIYKNLGNGQFGTVPIIKYQPVPLESSSGDSSFSGPKVVAESHAILDFDGDGWLDAVVRPIGDNGNGAYDWQVWLGDGTGGFGPTRYVFPTRDMNCPSPCSGAGDNALSGTGGFWGQYVTSSAGLIDVNGDGAQDHWLRLPDGNANIAFNDGAELRLFGASPPFMGEVSTSSSAPYVAK